MSTLGRSDNLRIFQQQQQNLRIAPKPAATTAALPSQPEQHQSCRLLQSRSRSTYYVNPNSLCPDLDVGVEVRVLEEGEHRPYDHYGLLDASYFQSAELLLRRQIDSPCRFDVFALDRMVEQPVYHFGMHLFHKCGFFQPNSGLYLDPVICGWLLLQISSLYHYRNPYHNQLHAIDVTQAFFVMLQQPGIQSKFHLDQLEVFTTLLAALCHDVDHPGCTAKYLCLFKHNNFFKAYNDRFCVLENAPVGKSIQFTLENHHTRMGCSLLRRSGLMDTLSLTKAEEESTLQLMKDLINATDMDRHKSLVQKFQDDLLRQQQQQSGSNDPEQEEQKKKKKKKQHKQPQNHQQHMQQKQPAAEAGSSDTRTVKMDLLELIIKCADIGNPFRDWPIGSAWADLVCQEFYRQGDLEEQCKAHCMTPDETAELPPFTGSLKRTAPVARVQINFINFFVLPLIKVYTQVEATSSSKVIQKTAERNLELWTMLDNMSEKTILTYLGPAADLVSKDQLDGILSRLLNEQKIIVTTRSVK